MKRSDLSHHVQEALKRLPKPYDHHYGVVPEPPPHSPSVLPVAARHQQAIAALARLETLATELQDAWLVSRILARREAVSSSAIEGTHSTLDELLTAEEGDESIASERLKGQLRQVRDYALCLDRLVPEASTQGLGVFSEELISELHRSVMMGEEAYKDIPGEYRNDVVWIGGSGNIAYSIYNPTPPADISICMADTISYLRGETDDINHTSLITRMAVAHAHFEAVHPFRDGNGRVGRLLLPLMMAGSGHVPLYLSPYIETNRAAYYSALKGAQQRHQWHEIIGFISDAIVETVRELTATRSALENLVTIWRLRRQFRSGSTAALALDVLKEYPIMSIRRLSEILGVTWPSAARAVEQLSEARIIKERTGYRRNKLYAASEALAIINRPFGEEPILPA